MTPLCFSSWNGAASPWPAPPKDSASTRQVNPSARQQFTPRRSGDEIKTGLTGLTGLRNSSEENPVDLVNPVSNLCAASSLRLNYVCDFGVLTDWLTGVNSKLT